MITLCLLLFLVLAFIAFFVFDMSRLQMAQRQLTALCDSAALSGSAMLTGQDISFETSASLGSLQQDQIAAMDYAKNSFCMGYILGQQAYDVSIGAQAGGIPVTQVFSGWQTGQPSAGGISVYIGLCSPVNSYNVVPAGNSTGRAILVEAGYGYVPWLASLGVPSIPITATSTGGLQKLMVIMVFDVSGSMDDDTVVSFVYRRWSNSTDSSSIQSANGNQGEYVYQVVGSPGTTGQLWEYSGFNYGVQPNGTALNVLPPQNLTYIGSIYNGNYTGPGGGSNTSPYNAATGSPPLAFDFAIRSYVPWPGAQNPTTAGVCYPYPTSGPNGANGGLAVTTANYPGPFYDNDFGTPPGNCPVKYGPAQTANASINPAAISNVWSSWNASGTGTMWSQVPEYIYSPGFYYYGGAGTTITASSTSDGNIYYFDPYSMPQAYANSANSSYTAFTDLVANIAPPQNPTGTALPLNQPFYGSSTYYSTVGFTGFNYTFPAATSTYYVGVAENGANLDVSVPYESDTDLVNQAFNFSSIAYVVEASRGNLDKDPTGSATNFVNALLLYGNNLGDSATTMQAACKKGYQKAYQRLAMYCSQPCATAKDGAYRFFQNLVQLSDTVFGFTAFSVSPKDTVGPQYGTGVDTSIWLATPTAAAAAGTSVYSPFVWQGSSLINPNFWVWSPLTLGQAGPAASPTNIPYSSGYNAGGPNATTWLSISSGGAPSGAGTGPPASTNSGLGTPAWGFTNWGFQIPRSPLPVGANSDQSSIADAAGYTSFGQCCAPGMWSTYNFTGSGNAFPNGGYHGLSHCMPLYGTEALEALYTGTSSAYTQLLDSASPSGGFTGTTAGPGSKQAVVFFTDGVPTDDTTPFPNYKTVATKLSSIGAPVYAIGLCLNGTIKGEQATLLTDLTNKGAYGSSYSQVSGEANLLSSFSAMARQLAQCQR